MEEWFKHPTYDDYWRDEDCTLHFAKMNVPCFTLGSWFDFMNQGSIASFQGRQHQGGKNSRGKQQLVIGPWLHGRGNRTSKIAEMVFPASASWPQHDHMVRWFKHYLRGEDNGVEKEPIVRYYIMGAVGEEAAPAFDVGWISQVFNKGHRIRVTVASTGAPLYEPNPQTGEALTIEFPKNAVPATNTIHHNRKDASRIIAPLPTEP